MDPQHWYQGKENVCPGELAIVVKDLLVLAVEEGGRAAQVHPQRVQRF